MRGIERIVQRKGDGQRQRKTGRWRNERNRDGFDRRQRQRRTGRGMS